MKELRTREIKIRLSEIEFITLQQLKTKSRLAEWIRELALGQKPKQQYKKFDPNLLYEINRIGVNLNQIARYCNNIPASIDIVKIALSLQKIEMELQQIIDRID